MKVLLNNHVPFTLAHGGAQIQIERSKEALEDLGVEIENLEWWNEGQQGQILHHFGHLPLPLVRLAKKKGLKVAITILLTETCNRPKGELLLRQVCIRSALAAPLPQKIKTQLPWQPYREADAMIVGLEAERQILESGYGIPNSSISIVPYGLTDTYLNAKAAVRTEDHLITQGRIGPTKNCLELARLAHAAKVPILFVGKPFDFRSNYWGQFRELVDGKYVKHHEHVATEAGMVELLRRARGYVLMSRYENWCLAAHEAAACGLPVLVPDQRWARERFGSLASYFPRKTGSGEAHALRKFYDESLNLPSSRPLLFSWRQVAEMLRDIYVRLMGSTTSPQRLPG
jgi:glycosyltransferase involved in cell wall biosynthesis